MSAWNGFTILRSARDRKCLDCGGYIQQGEKYAAWTGLCAEEGHFFTAKVCIECMEIWKECQEESGEPMWFGGLYDELEAGKGCSQEADARLERFLQNQKRRRGLFAEVS